MDEGNSIIYGIEHQTRALSPQLAENNAIRFLIGTQSLKPNSNQVHVVELEEDTGALHTKVFKHELGEIWHLRCSPHEASTLTTVHNSYDPTTSQCIMGVSILKLPTTDVIPKDLDDLTIQGRNPEDLKLMQTITPVKAEEEVRNCEWHPSEASKIGVVYEGAVRVFDITKDSCTSTSVPEGRAHNKFSGGKWHPHQGQTQFAALQDTHIKCYDTRQETQKPAWTIDSAHCQLVRDLDFNPNRQFQLATVGDDAALNIWDFRNGKQAIFTRTDHSHWVWTVRYNNYHEQLLLTGSSDARALLTAAVTVCKDEDDTKQGGDVMEDGVLQSYEQHEDSVYCAEWSEADPWTFASLSYDGRLVLSRVPRHFKYKILL